MILAAAQTIPKRNNVTKNLEDHFRLTNIAADHGAKLIVFPEMSLTGYEREEAKMLSFFPEDPRLSALRRLSFERDIIILAGAPILLVTGLHIGMFVLRPGLTDVIYTKQFLHDGEEEYFVPGSNTDIQFALGNEIISPAICADITNPIHAKRASEHNATLYIASIFYTPHGMDEGFRDLQNYANDLAMTVLMSNFGGESYGFEAAGRSACWTDTGALVGCLPEAGEGLLIIKKMDNTWIQEVVKVS